MSSTASRIPRKVCVHLSKSANPIGRIAERPRRFFIRTIFSCAVFSHALTLPRARHTLKFQFAGKGSGEGRANRPRSRHCDRLKSRKPGYPPVPRGLRFSREEAPSLSPNAARVGLFRWRRFLVTGTWLRMFIHSTLRAVAAAALVLLFTGAVICASQATAPPLPALPAYR